jgi:Tfp pilus tip-associated adhesin PilY1
MFVVDASNGNLIWKLAYTTPTGTPDEPNSSGFLTDDSTDDNKFLTTAAVFNYPIPSASLAVDKDSNGFLDTIYFGNIGGHLFKANISDPDPGNWTAQLIFEDKYIPQKGPVKISSISGTDLTLSSKVFAVGDSIMGQTSYAFGHVTVVNNKVITVIVDSGTFQVNENVVSYDYDPIYLIPAVAYDTCYQLWVTFGTGDRDRPRTNLSKGRFIAMRDNGALNFIEDTSGSITSSTLAKFSWVNNVFTPPSPMPTNVNGLYFNFPDTGEKIFDPESIILPDTNMIPHIYLNTYQPPATAVSNKIDPCDLPQEGVMKLYDIALKSCGALESIEGERETGRIAGGGIYAGKEYVMYTSESGDVADVPGDEGGQFTADPKRLPYPGGLVFWKEKKR